MVGVVTTGTASKVFIGAPYQAAGKTGTAQVYSLQGANYKGHAIAEHLRDHALFIAFAPADHPKIALALIVENGGWGAEAAGPIARQRARLLPRRPAEAGRGSGGRGGGGIGDGRRGGAGDRRSADARRTRRWPVAAAAVPAGRRSAGIALPCWRVGGAPRPRPRRASPAAPASGFVRAGIASASQRRAAIRRCRAAAADHRAGAAKDPCRANRAAAPTASGKRAGADRRRAVAATTASARDTPPAGFRRHRRVKENRHAIRQARLARPHQEHVRRLRPPARADRVPAAVRRHRDAVQREPRHARPGGRPAAQHHADLRADVGARQRAAAPR